MAHNCCDECHSDWEMGEGCSEDCPTLEDDYEELHDDPDRVGEDPITGLF